MEYQLKFNETGKLQGFQHIRYELCGMKLWQTHYINSSGNETDENFDIMVFNPRTKDAYFFRGEDWGTIEITVDAAETFATTGNLQYVQVRELSHWIVKPLTEEVLV